MCRQVIITDVVFRHHACRKEGEMGSRNLLFTEAGRALTPREIRQRIAKFGYKQAVQETIQDSKVLDRDVFVRCTARILSNFKMTRSGPFKGVEIARNGTVNNKEILVKCWNEIGHDLMDVRRSVCNSGYSRDRYLLELSKRERERLTAEIWSMTKQLLPLTMGETSYGLVGASKVLFAVLPEIVLPVDNRQWLKVFRTVDLRDVIERMVADIQEWENARRARLNEMDQSRMLTTLPSVYNVMAMQARPK